MCHFKLPKHITRCLTATNSIDTLISPCKADLGYGLALCLRVLLLVRGVGRALANWYLETVLAHGRAGSFFLSLHRCQGLGEGTPASLFPHGHGRLERHFPRLPRWMVTNSRGRGLCECCTVYHWLLLAALWRGLKAAWPRPLEEKHKCCWIALLLENVFTNDHLPPI